MLGSVGPESAARKLIRKVFGKHQEVPIGGCKEARKGQLEAR